jgi:hypothetical protein
VAVHGSEITDREPGPARSATTDIGPRGRVVRIAAAAAAAGLLIYGTVAGSNDMFPFGPFSMYAGRYPANGVISSNTLMAHKADGRVVVVTEADTGLTRAELEGELHAFQADPDRLADLAQAYHRRHPRASPYVAVWIAQKRWRLHDRAVVGQSTITLVEWRSQ